MNSNIGATATGSVQGVTISTGFTGWSSINAKTGTSNSGNSQGLKLDKVEVETVNFNATIEDTKGHHEADPHNKTAGAVLGELPNKTIDTNKKEDNKLTVGSFFGTLGIAALCGLGQGLEQPIDCTLQATAEVAWLHLQPVKGLFLLFGWEEGANAISGFERESGDWLRDAVGTNWTKKWTDDWIDSAGIRNDSTDTIVDWTRKVEDSFGSAMLSKLPGPWAGIATAVTSEGKSAEKAYQSGASFGEVALVSHAEGIIGFIKGIALKKISSDIKLSSAKADSFMVDGVDKSFGSLMIENFKEIGAKGFFSAIGASTGTTVATDILKSGIKYFTYGKDKKDSDGNIVYDNFFQYFIKEDGASTLTDTFFSGILAPVTAATGIDLKAGGFWSSLFKKIGIDLSKKGIEDTIKG